MRNDTSAIARGVIRVILILEARRHGNTPPLCFFASSVVLSNFVTLTLHSYVLAKMLRNSSGSDHGIDKTVQFAGSKYQWFENEIDRGDR